MPVFNSGIIYYDKHKETYELILQLKLGWLNQYGCQINSTKFNINDYPKIIHFSKKTQLENYGNCNILIKKYFGIVCRDNLVLMAKKIIICGFNSDLSHTLNIMKRDIVYVDKICKQYNLYISQGTIDNLINNKVNKYEYKYEIGNDDKIKWLNFTEVCGKMFKLRDQVTIDQMESQIIHLVGQDILKNTQD